MHADIHVFTFKAGLLARVAHDLRLHVQRHALQVSAGKVRGHCDADSLIVDGVMTERGLDRAGLSDKDKLTIRETVRREILHSDVHPRIELEGDVSADASRGTIEARSACAAEAAPCTCSCNAAAISCKVRSSSRPPSSASRPTRRSAVPSSCRTACGWR